MKQICIKFLLSMDSLVKILIRLYNYKIFNIFCNLSVINYNLFGFYLALQLNNLNRNMQLLNNV